MPEETLHRRKEKLKDMNAGAVEITEQEMEEQRQRVLADLRLSATGGFHDHQTEQVYACGL